MRIRGLSGREGDTQKRILRIFFGLEERRFFDRLEEEHKGIGEESNCNQGCPGMLLVILGIITHIRFLRAFVSEYLIYC